MLTLSKLALAAVDWAKISWAWSKKNWKFLTGFLVATLIFLITRKKFDWEKYAKRAKKDYEKEVKAIKKSHEKEIEDREEALEDYIDKSQKISEEHKQKLLDLDEKTRKRAVELFKESDGDESQITEKLSELTGFKIHD